MFYIYIYIYIHIYIYLFVSHIYVCEASAKKAISKTIFPRSTLLNGFNTYIYIYIYITVYIFKYIIYLSSILVMSQCNFLDICPSSFSHLRKS